MKRARNLFLIICLFLPFSLFSRMIVYSWSWGIERIDRSDYFLLDLRPEFHYNPFHLKLSIPVEVNSNWTLNKDRWDDPREDILTKVDYLTITNKAYLVRLSSLERLDLGNGELVNDYANTLFEPFHEKRGLSAFFSYRRFRLDLVADDLVRYERFFAQFSYRTGKADTGILYAADRTASVNKLDLYLDYRLLSVQGWGLSLPLDYIQDLGGRYFAAAGLGLAYRDLFSFVNKVRYFASQKKERLYFGHFYTLAREDDRITAGGAGLSSELRIGLFRFLSLSLYAFTIPGLKPGSRFVLRTGERFPSRVSFLFEIFNRNNTEWYDVFLETERNTHLAMRSSVPLSRNLKLKLEYLKSFSEEAPELRGVHTILFLTEFTF